MKTSKITKYAGTVVLFLVWIWLGWGLLSGAGVNLKNLLILAMSGIIIFLPLYKKYFSGASSENDKGA